MPTPTPVAATPLAWQPLAVAETWDREAREAAWHSARDLAERDPDAALVLLAHLERTAPAATPDIPTPTPAPAPRSVYNPTRLYAIVIRARGWSWRDCNDCHFPFFFGLLRELTLLDEEEEQRSDAKMEQMRGRLASNKAAVNTLEQDSDINAIMAYAQQPRAWGQ